MIIISLTGPKGCGKSTYSGEIAEFVKKSGLRVYTVKADRISFSYSIAHFIAWLRRKMNRKTENNTLFRIDAAGLRETKLGKGRTRSSLIKSTQRIFTYVINAVIFRIFSVIKSRVYDVMICDRYSYDYLVRMPHPDGLFARMIHSIYPTPVLSMYLKIEADIGILRREGSTLEYYSSMNTAYETLTYIYKDLLTIDCPNNDEPSRRQLVLSHVEKAVSDSFLIPVHDSYQ